MINAQKASSDFRIKTYGDYHPYRVLGARNPLFDWYSGRLLDLKEGKLPAIAHFFHLVATDYNGGHYAVACIPPHSPERGASGVAHVASLLSQEKGWSDATHCLVRTKQIQKLAQGGDRSLHTQLTSMSVDDRGIIQGKRVILLDDITTTGHSFLAGYRLLLDAGAEFVQCVAFGKTARDY